MADNNNPDQPDARAARLAARNRDREEDPPVGNDDEDNVQIRNMSMRELIDFMDRRYPRAPVVEPGVRFALTPALVNPDHPIDYSSASGAKIFKSSTSSLLIKFDLEPKSINTFNEVLKDRCTSAGWDNPGNSIISI